MAKILNHIIILTIRISFSDLTTIIYVAMYKNNTSGQVFIFI